MSAVQIDLSQIPAADVRNLNQTFLTAVNRFYTNPENMKKFEVWKKQKEQNQ